MALSFLAVFWLAIAFSGYFVYLCLEQVFWGGGAMRLEGYLRYISSLDNPRPSEPPSPKERGLRLRPGQPPRTPAEKAWHSARWQRRQAQLRQWGLLRIPQNCRRDYRRLAQLMGYGCVYVRIYDPRGKLIAQDRDWRFARIEGEPELPPSPSPAMRELLFHNYRLLNENPPPPPGDPRGIAELHRSLAQGGEVVERAGFQFLDHQLVLRSLYHRFWRSGLQRLGITLPPPPPPQFGPLSLIYLSEPRYQILFIPLIDEGQFKGYLEAAVPWTFAHHALSLVGWVVLLGSLSLGLVVSLWGILIARILTNPLRQVMQTAAQLEKGKLQARVNLPPGRNEIYQLANTFDHMADTLEANFQEQQRFIGDASHELKTPLTSLMGTFHMLKLMLAEDHPSAKIEQTLNTIERELNRMEHLVVDLLTLSRNQELAARRPSDPINLNELLQRAVDASLSQALHHPIQLVPTRELFILGDEESLVRALRNILDNALRHTPLEKEIRLFVRVLADKVEIVVQDEGCGIAPEHLAHIGKRFYRADSGRDRLSGGTGLGLPIAEAILKRHGGSLHIASQPGRGTTVTLTLSFLNLGP